MWRARTACRALSALAPKRICSIPNKSSNASNNTRIPFLKGTARFPLISAYLQRRQFASGNSTVSSLNSTISTNQVIALLGRPNVGKSTLFNSLVVGDEMAANSGKMRTKRLVHAVAGTTRDRFYGSGEWLSKRYTVVDTGGLVMGDADRLKQLQMRESEEMRLMQNFTPKRALKDSINVLSIKQNAVAAAKSRGFASQMRQQTRTALQEARVVLFVVDGEEGVTQQDFHIARELRKNLYGRGVHVVTGTAGIDDLAVQAASASHDFVVSDRDRNGKSELVGANVSNDEESGSDIHAAEEHEFNISEFEFDENDLEEGESTSASDSESDDDDDDDNELMQDANMSEHGQSPDQRVRVLVVANKCDNDAREEVMRQQCVRLGFGQPICVSALHGRGVLDVLTAAVHDFESTPANDKDQPSDEEELHAHSEPRPERIRVAIVGRPNVGKSSFVNTVVGEERMVVSDIAGTTHDPVDCDVELNDGTALTLIDTAGIRRAARLEAGLEKLTVMWSMRAIERAHVVVLLIDPEGAVTSQEQAIVRHAVQHYKSIVLAVNKWDHLLESMEAGVARSQKENDAEARAQFEAHIQDQLKFIPFAPMHFISAKTGAGFRDLMNTVKHVFDERGQRFTTKLLMDTISDAVELHPPPTKKHNERVKRLKIKFATQSKGFPPSFVFWVNEPSLVHFSYSRFLENSLRAVHPFTGTPLRLTFRKNKANARSQGLREQTLFGKKKQPRPRPQATR